MAVPVTGGGLPEQMVQLAPDALLLVDWLGHIVYINEAGTLSVMRSAAGQGIERLVPERSKHHGCYRSGSAAPTTREMGARPALCLSEGWHGISPKWLAPLSQEAGDHCGGGMSRTAIPTNCVQRTETEGASKVDPLPCREP